MDSKVKHGLTYKAKHLQELTDSSKDSGLSEFVLKRFPLGPNPCTVNDAKRYRVVRSLKGSTKAAPKKKAKRKSLTDERKPTVSKRNSLTSTRASKGGVLLPDMSEYSAQDLVPLNVTAEEFNRGVKEFSVCSSATDSQFLGES